VHPQCFERRGYLAGDDRRRAGALEEVFADDRYKAVFCARGGYGCARLLRHLDINAIAAKPKIFVGYSDITVLLQAFSIAGNLVTFHGPMPSIDLCRTNYRYSFDNLIKAVTQSRPIGRLDNPKQLGRFKKLHAGRATGILTGGNLSLLQKLIGTEYEPSFKNKIVFIEDKDEDPYRLDGYLNHLFTATDFSQAAGFVIGEWIDCNITDRARPSLTLRQVVMDYFGSLKAPVIGNVACGHGNHVMTLPIGVNAALDADKGVFQITSNAVV